MKMRILVITALVSAFFVACAVSGSRISENDLGGFRDADLLDDANVTLKDINYTKEPAGMAKIFERSFENAPPFIPHDTEGLVPITKDLNMCVTCHMPEFAKDSGATQIPTSHFYDIRNKKDLAGALDDERYNCTACHVEQQGGVTAFVKNNFKPSFRDSNGSHKSNLLDVLNDGVK
ncbi:MAG: nitrate reductase cytochrome c-type subunit [Campylobacter sp.]|nr:nitrate reductase cytochrome c-type subunit [Campylobacter sp.]